MKRSAPPSWRPRYGYSDALVNEPRFAAWMARTAHALAQTFGVTDGDVSGCFRDALKSFWCMQRIVHAFVSTPRLILSQHGDDVHVDSCTNRELDELYDRNDDGDRGRTAYAQAASKLEVKLLVFPGFSVDDKPEVRAVVTTQAKI